MTERRVPIGATVLVAVAVAAMIALGVWQLTVRLPEKDAQLARLARNPTRAEIAFPRAPDDRLLFRRAVATCRPPVTLTRAGAGKAGFRVIATCAADADGPAFKVQLGTTRDPNRRVAWSGGAVRGWVSHAPDATPLIVQAFRAQSQEMLLIAASPVAGLAANTRPDIGLVPNNHLAYGVQWFVFAGVAGVIYALALRARGR